MPPSKRRRAGPGHSFQDGGGRDNKRSKLNYNTTYRVASKLISGPGIFVTCVQGKEKKAALQFIDYLNDIADRIYPNVQLIVSTETDHQQSNSISAETDIQDDDDLDELRNGKVEQVHQEMQEGEEKEQVKEMKTEKEEEKKEEKKEEEDDLEAQIRAELAELHGDANKKNRNHSSKKQSKATLQKFKKVETDTECLLFISCTRPIDPYTMVYTLLEEVENTGEPRGRFVQRLSPISDTCPANEQQVSALAQRIIPTFFPPDGPAKTFKIDPRIRSHNILKRDQLIHLVASAIPKSGGHQANLKTPDYWIIIEVHKNVCAIGVVRDYERFKKLNLLSVAESIHQQSNDQKKQEENGTTTLFMGRVAGSLSKKDTTTVQSDQPKEKEEEGQKDVIVEEKQEEGKKEIIDQDKDESL